MQKAFEDVDASRENNKYYMDRLRWPYHNIISHHRVTTTGELFGLEIRVICKNLT
jgi:hypothetical protein